MPTTTRTVFLTDENGNALIDAQGNMRALSFSLMQGYSYRLVERASIVSATYAQVVGYSTATGQTITGVENASEFDVGDFGIVQYAISDRNNTIGYVTCEVTAVGTDSLTVNGIGISVAGADGAPGADGATFTPAVDAEGNLSWTNDGGLPNPENVNVRGAQGEAATVQVGTTTTLPAGSQATVNNSGTSNAAVLNFGIPTGQPGADGQAATIAVGEVTTGAAGSQASVTNSGNENAAVLDFTIPKGADGASGVTDVTAGTPTEQDGYTVTPVTFDFEQGNSKTVEIKAKNGEGGGGSSTSNEVIDLGTVTLTGTNEELSGAVTVTPEQFTKLTTSPYPQLKMNIAELGGGTIGTFCLSYCMHDTNGNMVMYSAMMLESSRALISIMFYAQSSSSSGSISAGVVVQNNDLGNDLPSGGTTGQVLKKKSNTEYDVEWGDIPNGGGVEIVDLGTPTFQEANGGQYLLANLTLTSEQAAKLADEPAPIVKFRLSGANGDYQNGAYYLTKTYLMGVGLHMYNTCFQVQDNGGWAITLQMGGTSAAITIYPYKIPQVEANPSDSTSVTLEKLKVGNTIYAIPQGGGTAEVTKEAIATALNLSTTQLDVLVSLAQKVTITGDDVKFATGTVLKSSSFDAVD